jgi:Zn-dependent peptidase ImmA (M78 family)/transcriptional regulator with XRE-family HTH domain
MATVDEGRLNEAARLAPLTSAHRLRLAREMRGWSQRELVDQMAETGHSVSTAALSQLELGRSVPTARTLSSIAEAVDIPLEYFVRRDADMELDGFFRSLRSAPVKDRRWAMARAHLLHDFVRVLEHFVELPKLDVPDLERKLRSRDEIEAAAAAVRRSWGLGDGPISNMVRELERHGIATMRLTLERSKLDAFSVWFLDRPTVVLCADKGNTARSRFDAAHELGHGVLHDSLDIGTKEVESEAHQFAASFLMPEATIRSLLSPSINWRDLMDLKAQWGVSLGALLIRARDLDVLSPARYVSAMKYMSGRGWRKSEPGDQLLGDPEEPRIVSAAIREVEGLGLSLEDLCHDSGLPYTDVLALVDPSGGGRRRVEA